MVSVIGTDCIGTVGMLPKRKAPFPKENRWVAKGPGPLIGISEYRRENPGFGLARPTWS